MKMKMNLGKTTKPRSREPRSPKDRSSINTNFDLALQAPEVKNQSKGPIDLESARAEVKKRMAPFRRG